eukprot:12418876-Karenia_brevis.AAC.1
MWRNGAMLRVMQRRTKGAGKGFPQMHCKTTIYDESIVLTGSAKITHNAVEHNKEHLVRIKCERTVA